MTSYPPARPTDDDLDSESLLHPTHRPLRLPHPSPPPFFVTTRKLPLLLSLLALILVFSATVGSTEGARDRVKQGLEGVKQQWDGVKAWGWRTAGVSTIDTEERFLGYLPHSGFHNQRIALVNGLFLASLLNRTLLLPPAWIGWPVALEYYEDLQQSWTNQVLMHPTSFGLPPHPPDFFAAALSSNNSSASLDPLYLPAHYPSTFATFPSLSAIDPATRHANAAASLALKTAKWRAQGYAIRPDGFPDVPGMKEQQCKSRKPECRSFVNDTWLGWGELVDLKKSVVDKGLGKVRQRWDMRERGIEELLGVTREDVLVFDDEERYDLQFVDDDTPLPLSAFPPLITPLNDTARFKRVVSVPAMRLLPQRVLLVGSLFGYQRVFHPLKMSAHRTLEASLPFSNPHILEPAREIRDRLGGSEVYVGVHARIGDGVFKNNAEVNMRVLFEHLADRIGLEKEVENALLDAKPPFELPPTPNPLPRPPLIPESSSNLTCRFALHTSKSLLPLNTPLFLATDAPLPPTSPPLSLLYRNFPCIFLLSHFAQLPSVERMKALTNERDGVRLGGLFTPFVEATVASMGRETVGTDGSTFSQYAESTLHDAFVLDAGLDAS